VEDRPFTVSLIAIGSPQNDTLKVASRKARRFDSYDVRVKPTVILLAAIFLTSAACSSANERGIADKRSDFQKFLPMSGDPAKDGLKAVQPYFKSVNRAQILRAIENACRGAGANGRRKEGSSDFNPSTGAGYYVNCNPENRQLLNGYVPAKGSRAPHSR